ncbi:TonB-dependent siderophore receptor [Bradyrhizobium semiaridum]|uniref:TonB-dependent siderophore receptor n=1 Tax=Bradyrhizobium semiaridum TaxID=2821404 RepID=UPI001CE28E2A|nr:TonB-dependent receptor [Bradyrhizobium semiaridum]
MLCHERNNHPATLRLRGVQLLRCNRLIYVRRDQCERRLLPEAGTVGYQFEHAFNNAVKLRQNFRYYTSQTDWDYLLLTGIAADGRTGNRNVSSRIEKGEGIAVDSSVEAKLGWGPAVHTVIAGIDYYHSVLDSTRYQGTASPIDIFNPVYGSPVVVNRSVNRGSVTTGDQLGFYAQDQIKLYDKLVLLVGGRKDFSNIDTLISRTNARSVQEDDAWTGRIGGVYLTDFGLAPYASFSQSFQPNLGTDRLNNQFLPSRGETVEAGVHYQIPGSRMLISAAAFEIRQTNVLTPDPVDITYSVQSGEVTSRGVEFEAKAEFGPLAMVASYTYTDTRTTRSTNTALLGERLAFVPYNTASIWGIYDFGSLGWHGFNFGGGVRYVGDTNLPGVAFNVPDYTVADLVASYDLKYLARELNGFQARLNVKNLFNNGYVICVSSGGCRYGDPQTVIATLSYRW